MQLCYESQGNKAGKEKQIIDRWKMEQKCFQLVSAKHTVDYINYSRKSTLKGKDTSLHLRKPMNDK